MTPRSPTTHPSPTASPTRSPTPSGSLARPGPSAPPRPPAPQAPQAPAVTKRIWTIEDLREIQALTVRDPGALLRERDRRGESPVAFAAIQAALTSDRLLPLLDLLESKEGESKIEILVAAVEALLDGQKEIRAGQKEILAGQAELRSMLVAIGRKLAA